MIAALIAAVTATFAPHEQATPTRGAAAHVVVAPPPAPPELARELRAAGEGFNGRVGIAIRDVQSGWTAEFNGDELFPQQSVSKLWVALATFDDIDHGRARLDEPVVMRREDLSVFHQPIRGRIDSDGYETTVDELLTYALAKSDNAANDFLMRKTGGGQAVQDVIRNKGLGKIRAGTEERLLQAKIAGMTWRPEYGIDWGFQYARAELPDAYRKAKLDEYVADPDDGAAPTAIVAALARLKKGQLLSRPSTDRMLEILSETVTGRSRLRSGLPDGWTIAHKTGTGQELGARVTGWNDVGLLTAPDGRTYAVAVMIADTTAPAGQCNALFQKVARLVADFHDKRFAEQQQTQNDTGEAAEKAA
ncbi:MAG TPA: class A beta-lactamase [Caulobacteraceae bacterium]